jgi:hypothetical protein
MSKWTTRGRQSLDLAATEPRRLSFKVRSAGCSILCGNNEDDAQLIYSGSGTAHVRVTVFGSLLFILPFSKDGLVAVEVPELRDEPVGWTNEASLTDLAPRPFGQISPEVQAAIDQMNRNAIVRELAMLKALRQRVL